MSIISKKYSDKFYLILYNTVNIKNIFNLTRIHIRFRKGL